MNRRPFLALLGSTALAGCTGLATSEDDPATDREPYGTDDDQWVSSRSTPADDPAAVVNDRDMGEDILEYGDLVITDHERHPGTPAVTDDDSTLVEALVENTGSHSYEDVVVHIRLYDDDGIELGEQGVTLTDTHRVETDDGRVDSMGVLEGGDHWPVTLQRRGLNEDRVDTHSIAVAGTQTTNSRDEPDREDAFYVTVYTEPELIVGETEHGVALLLEDVPAAVDELLIDFGYDALAGQGVTFDELALEEVRIEGNQHGQSSRFELDERGRRDNTLELTLQTAGERAIYVEWLLTGLETTDAEHATDLEYAIEIDAAVDEYQHHNFDLVDPETRQPVVSPSLLQADTEEQSQQLAIDWLSPTAETLGIEIDTTVLEAYGSLEELSITDVHVENGAVSEDAVSDGIVSLEIEPTADTLFLDGSVQLEGIDITETEPVADLRYDVSLEGAAHDSASVDAFAILDADGRETDDDAVEVTDDTDDTE